jgi:RNA polymerase sigma-70 factor (ECF subfamily)
MADTEERSPEELYKAHCEPLFRYALALTCSRDDAEDAVQTVFVRVFRQGHRLARVKNVKAYLFSAVRNAAFNILRSKRRQEAVQASLCAAFEVDLHAANEKDRFEARILCEALDELPLDQREVLILKILDEMTLREIADTVGASINTVASRYRYGIQKLRKALEVDDNG